MTRVRVNRSRRATPASDTKATDKSPKDTRGTRNTTTLIQKIIERMDAKKRLAEYNSERAARGLKEVSQMEIWDTAQKGLSLLISSGGTKSFRSTYKLHGKWQSRALGRFDEVVRDDGENAKVAWARDRVRKDRALAKAGIDPKEGEVPLDTSYEAVVDRFIDEYAKPRQRTWKQTQRTLKFNCKAWLKKPINTIAKQDVYKLLDKLVAEGKGPTADQTLTWLKTLWRWAWKRDLVVSPIMDAIDRPDYVKRKRDRVYDDDEVKAIWNAANKLDPTQAGYVKLLLLLAPRKTALAKMEWAELDGKDNPTTWTTPPERVKQSKKKQADSAEPRTYITPLPPLAQRIIKSLPRKDETLVFPGRVKDTTLDPGTPLAKKLIDHGAPSDFNYHAARHTISSWLKDQGHSLFERGLILNHAESGVTAGYSHGLALDLKLQLLTKWAEHVAKLVTPKGVALHH